MSDKENVINDLVKLREVSLYTRSLIEASLDPLVTISPDGKITDVNMATELVTGVSRDKLIGKDFSDYFRMRYRPTVICPIFSEYPHKTTKYYIFQ